MKILSINCYCDGNTFATLFNSMRIKPEVSIQKYFQLFLRGLTKNGTEVNVISERQISYKEKAFFFKGYKTFDDSTGTNIKYIPIIAVPVLYQLWLFIHALFYTPFYFIKEGKPDYIICDIMRFYSSFPTLLIGKLMNVKVIGYVADIPQMYHHQSLNRQPWYKRIMKSIYSCVSKYYDSYIMLSEYMNEHVNKANRPYIIIEGIVDKCDARLIEPTKNNVQPLSIMYSGGLYEKYGVKMLIEAFEQIDGNIELWLFGKGDLDHYIACLNDNRIKYYGYKDNAFVIAKQEEATFLINPRPSKEEYTKYSFPSKLMEYMNSGTPVISSKLLSIPDEYWEYLIPIEEDTVCSIKNAIEFAMKKNEEERNTQGRSARSFVFNNKNYLVQGGKIVNWLQILQKA